MASEAEKIMSETLHQWHRLPREHWAKHCPSTVAFLAVLQTSEDKSPWECAQEIPISQKRPGSELLAKRELLLENSMDSTATREAGTLASVIGCHLPPLEGPESQKPL